MKKNVMIVGNGGREHSLLWKLAQSNQVDKLFVAPGNGGTQKIAKNICLNDIIGLLKFAKENCIDLTVVNQEDLLSKGIVDIFQCHGLKIFGPACGAAHIESSKYFAKSLMTHNNIPTGASQPIFNYDAGIKYIHTHGLPVVIKADGLANGKGAYVCRTIEKAEEVMHDLIIKKIYGDAGKMIIIEDFLEGSEISIHAFSDGKNFVLFPPSQDHKPIFDGDLGDNTGGMGTIAPVPWFSQNMLKEAGAKIVKPVLKRLSVIGNPFVGCLYPGLMMTPSGMMVLEYNARFGDPETQSYMRLLKTDLLNIFEACINGTLDKCKIEWRPGFAVCIVLTSSGYPGAFKKGFPISGIEDAEKIPGVVIFHAGTTIEDGILKTYGGRVLNVTATGDTLKQALQRAYHAVDWIKFNGMHYRKDIGAKSLAMIKK